jgi:hypothetical protein
MTEPLCPQPRWQTSVRRLVDSSTFGNLVVAAVSPISSPPARLVDWLLR